MLRNRFRMGSCIRSIGNKKHYPISFATVKALIMKVEGQKGMVSGGICQRNQVLSGAFPLIFLTIQETQKDFYLTYWIYVYILPRISHNIF